MHLALFQKNHDPLRWRKRHACAIKQTKAITHYHISISKTSDKIIECTIEDNGIGREKSKKINTKREGQHKSFALKATTERLDLLNYGRDKKIGVEFIDLKDNEKAVGTKVILVIPIIKK